MMCLSVYSCCAPGFATGPIAAGEPAQGSWGVLILRYFLSFQAPTVSCILREMDALSFIVPIMPQAKLFYVH